MNKSQFVQMILPSLRYNDKPFNRQLWNDTMYHFDSQLPKRAYSWIKTPKKYFGEEA